MFKHKISLLGLVLIVSAVLFSCGKNGSAGSEDELLNRAKQLSDSSNAVNSKEVRMQAIKLYEDFVAKFPKSDKLPEVYSKIAELYFGVDDYQKTISTYNTVFEKYPDTKYGRQALFMSAFIYDNQLNDKPKALETYKKYVEKYPKDAEGENFTESAKGMIDIIENNKNIEDIIKNNDSKKDEQKKDDAKQDQVPPKKQNTMEKAPENPNVDKPVKK
ncbi:MAG TPA: tetratricopeptide repeat protein [Ignavibacteria bacterium]|nr:tetratricopeptide repeat protein [Ignavibacteria bacterium]